MLPIRHPITEGQIIFLTKPTVFSSKTANVTFGTFGRQGLHLKRSSKSIFLQPILFSYVPAINKWGSRQGLLVFQIWTIQKLIMFLSYGIQQIFTLICFEGTTRFIKSNTWRKYYKMSCIQSYPNLYWQDIKLFTLYNVPCNHKFLIHYII